MKVSVIISVFNVEPYLRECLNSVINQTLKDIEIICVNDGSTDGSRAILEEYAKKDSRVIIIDQPNKGAGAARNNGMKLARGEYLSFLDADDFFEPTMLEKAYTKCKADSADIAVYKVYTYNNETKKISEAPWAVRESRLPGFVPFSYKDIPKYIFNSFQNWTWNKLFNAEFVRENGLSFQELRRTNDLLFTCSGLAAAVRITIVDDYLVYYRTGTQTSSQATNDLAPLDFYSAFMAFKACLQNKGIYEQVKQSFINHALSGCIYNLNSIKSSDAYKVVFNKIKKDSFNDFDFCQLSVDNCYNKSEYRELQKIKNLTLAEYLEQKNKADKPGIFVLIFRTASRFFRGCCKYGLKYTLKYGLDTLSEAIRRNKT